MLDNLDENQIKKLLEESFGNIQFLANQDTKKLANLNNGLNWILTFTTIFFVFFYKSEANLAESKENYFLFAYKGIFLLLVVILIVHKVFYVKYEDLKSAYLGTLHSHQIDLKFTYPDWKDKIEKIAPYTTVSFSNSFRNGEFIYHTRQDIARKELKELDNKIIFCGKWIKRTYSIGLFLFILDFILVFIVLFN
jgi:hypothetical protein